MNNCTATTALPIWAPVVCEACGEALSAPTFGTMHKRCVRRLLSR